MLIANLLHRATNRKGLERLAFTRENRKTYSVTTCPPGKASTGCPGIPPVMFRAPPLSGPKIVFGPIMWPKSAGMPPGIRLPGIGPAMGTL